MLVCGVLCVQVSVFINMFVTCVFAAGFYGELHQHRLRRAGAHSRQPELVVASAAQTSRGILCMHVNQLPPPLLLLWLLLCR